MENVFLSVVFNIAQHVKAKTSAINAAEEQFSLTMERHAPTTAELMAVQPVTAAAPAPAAIPAILPTPRRQPVL